MRWLLRFSVALALIVVILGAYTRLVHAGLGCPDWPGCYGFLSVPEAPHEVDQAELRFPHAPVEAEKAWAEMVHRYFAGTLGLLIFAMAGMALLQSVRGHSPGQFLLPGGLAVLVVCQAAFGMWTVTLKLWPQVVTAHLLGGFATLGLLWLSLVRFGVQPNSDLSRLRGLALLALILLVIQITLGGWASSNYAALACPDFPTCQGEWWPAADFVQGFNVTQHIGPNYLGGLLQSDARIAIHLTHRLGALMLLLVVGLLVYRLGQDRHQRRLAGLLGMLLMLQISLGIANVLFGLPLVVAVAHNAVAALLLLSLITVNYRAFRSTTHSTTHSTRRSTTSTTRSIAIESDTQSP